MKERVSSLGVRQPWQLSTLLFTESRVVAWEILGLCDRQGSLARSRRIEVDQVHSDVVLVGE